MQPVRLEKIAQPATTDEPERSLYLLGYSAALAGLLLHAVVDISVHFASSGLLLAVFIGVILALSIPKNELETTPAQPARHPRTLLIARGGVSLAVLAVLVYTMVEFVRMLRHLALTSLGEGTLFALAAVTFLGCVIGVGIVYVKTLWKTTRVAVCVVLLVSVPLCLGFFNLFTANHYYSLGVALINLQQPYAALPAFTDAIKRNPSSTEYRQYRGNIFAMTLDLSKRFSPALGDTDSPRTDFDRALADFDFVHRHNPNHALLHQDLGQLYYALAVRQLNAAQQDPAQAFLYNQLATENFAQAKAALLYSLKLDPVNVNTYLMLINMALFRHDVTEAQNWVNAYRQGPAGVTEEEFLARHWDNPQMQALQAHIDRLRTL